jgi:predicted amidophosphoribosyltransferase
LIEAVVLLKYEEATRLGDWFAARLAEIVPRAPGNWRADVVVPVSLHRTAGANAATARRN